MLKFKGRVVRIFTGLVFVFSNACYADQDLNNVFGNLKKAIESVHNGSAKSTNNNQNTIETQNTAESTELKNKSIKTDSIFNQPSTVQTTSKPDSNDIYDEQCSMAIAFIKLMKSKEQRIAEVLTPEQIRLMTDRNSNINFEIEKEFGEKITVLYKELSPNTEWQYWANSKLDKGQIFGRFTVRSDFGLSQRYIKENNIASKPACFESIGLAYINPAKNTTAAERKAEIDANKSNGAYVGSLLKFQSNLEKSQAEIVAIAEKNAVDLQTRQAKAAADAVVLKKQQKFDQCYSQNKVVTDLSINSKGVISLNKSVNEFNTQLNTIARYPSRFTRKDYDDVLILHDIAVATLDSSWKKYKQAGGKARSIPEVVALNSPCDVFGNY